MNASHTIHVIVSISAIAIPCRIRRDKYVAVLIVVRRQRDACPASIRVSPKTGAWERTTSAAVYSFFVAILYVILAVDFFAALLTHFAPDTAVVSRALMIKFAHRATFTMEARLLAASAYFMVQAAVVAFSLRRPGIAQAIALTWALWPPICAFFGKYGVDARWICAWYREILLAARTSQGNVLSIAGVARKWVVLFFKSIRAAEGSKPVALFGVGVRVRRWTPFLFHAFACRTYIVFTTIAIRPATSTTTFRTHLSPCFSWTYPIFQRSPFVHQQQKIDREMSDPTDESARSSGVRSRHGPWHGGDRRFR
eukprot:GEMP01022924.1.p1 GENE.GEMP01022924.1~~GEMP01022924.1.p1  ORF type:complete len:311 (-),score=28.90 GEMP01022924.1:735-1667(-)